MDGRIVVIGSGIGGLSTALALGRAGHEVLVLERDALPTSGDAEEAFAAERRGAPQAHQTHGFLARLVVEMRRHFPDVLAALYDVGCVTVPARNNLGDPQPGDEDLAVLIVRRTTLEWLLREAALAQPGVELRPSCGVAGLSHHLVDDVPVIDGVRLADGRLIPASLVVDASGRRSTVPAMLGDAGRRRRRGGPRERADVPVALVPRARRCRGPARREARRRPRPPEVPRRPRRRAHAVDHPRGARRRRRAAAHLSDPDGFERAVRMLEGPSRFFAAGPLEPIGTVRPMAGLLNRTRRFLDDDGAPRVLGLHAVGDSHTCTNPLYGRGLLARPRPGAAARRRPRGPRRRRRRPGPRRTRRRVGARSSPGTTRRSRWTSPAPTRDRRRRHRATARPDGPGVRRRRDRPGHRPGLDAHDEPARHTGRAGRPTPSSPARVAAIFADPDAYPVPPRPGPTRRELLDALAGSAV